MRKSFKHLFIDYASYFLSSRGPARLFRNMTAGDGIIFTLHRVLPEATGSFQPNKLLEVTPEFLRKTVIQVRQAGYEFISLDDALERLQSKRQCSQKFAVLTFDDGYKDNRDVAYPVLKELDVPFTVFISSEYSKHNSELWWIIIEQLIAENDHISFRYEDKQFDYDCTSLKHKEASFVSARCMLISEVPEAKQRAVIREAAERYGLDWRVLCRELILSFEELRAFSQDPLVSLGAHTDTHPMLARLSTREDIRQHIQAGLEEMTAQLGKTPTVLAYPYGFAEAVDKRCESVAEELSFAAAVTTQPGTLTTENLKRRYHLPRVSLNGLHQQQRMVDVYLTGAAFAAYYAVKRVRSFLRRA
ncbi:Polysaccharide deacetylase [Pseudovibrio sp. Ad46]|uniref:polysaccharide deacetylase family protein n=1 Tax=unclassified Pseudovibrio TaxID=2627060 RepID=UPI0007B1E3D2|nr:MULTISPECIES: polysaccharide deacetylase family protein [unclassified Pseudovibrio]KZK80040.1 Polysaccharide deacetylase [Pseudovibrio sp. Ad46]KZK96360.1 Polysaccharide deacetylase [Pseudovibrio sp. Ad5]